MNEDIYDMDVKSLLEEESKLYEILNKPDTPIDHPMIPRLKAIKGEIDFRVLWGASNSDTNVIIKMLGGL